MSEKIIKQTFLQKTKRFFEPVRDNKLVTFQLFFYFILQFSFSIIFVFFVRHTTETLENGNYENVLQVIGFYTVLFIVLFVIILFINKWWIYSFNRYRSSIEAKYFPKFVRFDQNIQERIGTGKSIAIITKGIRMWGVMIDRIFIELIGFCISVGLVLFLLGEIHFYLSVGMLGLLMIGMYVGVKLNNKVLIWRKDRNELDNIWSKNVVKIIMAKMEILHSAKISKEVKKLHKLHEGQIFYNGKMSLYLVPFFLIGSVLVMVLLCFTFIYFGKMYFKGDISLGYIASLTGAFLMMQTVFLNTLDFLKNFGKEFTEVQNLWNFFDDTAQIQGYEDGETFIHKKGDIKLQDISYSYDDKKQVFKNFGVDIAGEKITAFVGPSGSGKSTLVKLISGYIRPDSGEILVDNQKLSETSLKSYYKDIGYLTQEPSVFDGTIRENLLYAVGDTIDDSQIAKVIELAHCEFIYDLVDGLDTEIGERGIKLLGGQKQRLAIAKIFLKDPKIIILDEPTSALDSISEKKITEAMHNLFRNRTVLVIAHRLQTVKHADDILVIENGEIIERGSHSSLIRKKGFYKQMLDLQSGF